MLAKDFKRFRNWKVVSPNFGVGGFKPNPMFADDRVITRRPTLPISDITIVIDRVEECAPSLRPRYATQRSRITSAMATNIMGSAKSPKISLAKGQENQRYVRRINPRSTHSPALILRNWSSVRERLQLVSEKLATRRTMLRT